VTGLKFLIRLCSDLGLKEATEYALELKKAEKAKEVRERIGSSRPGEYLLLLPVFPW
jgi:intraflagellar transport protein 88